MHGHGDEQHGRGERDARLAWKAPLRVAHGGAAAEGDHRAVQCRVDRLGAADERQRRRPPLVPQAFTKVNLVAVDDAAPANGFGDRWEARVAREALSAERTGVTYFRLRPGK